MKQDAIVSHLHSAPVPLTVDGPVGLFVDGENLQAWVAPLVMSIVGSPSDMRLSRVYGNCEHLHDWHKVAGVEIIHTGVPGNGDGETVKNAADVKIAVDAMEFALLEQGKTIILCSSDRDFTPLVWALRKQGRTVIGVGEAKASAGFQAACNRFVVTEAPDRTPVKDCSAVKPVSSKNGIDHKIRQAVERLGGSGKGCPISALNAELRRSDAFNISSLPNAADRQWRKYLANRPEIYRLDPKGPSAKVWLVKAGVPKS